MINFTTSAVNNAADLKKLDKQINKESARVVSLVKGAADYQIGTAAFIDGEFVVTSCYTIDRELRKELERVARL